MTAATLTCYIIPYTHNNFKILLWIPSANMPCFHSNLSTEILCINILDSKMNCVCARIGSDRHTVKLYAEHEIGTWVHCVGRTKRKEKSERETRTHWNYKFPAACVRAIDIFLCSVVFWTNQLSLPPFVFISLLAARKHIVDWRYEKEKHEAAGRIWFGRQNSISCDAYLQRCQRRMGAVANGRQNVVVIEIAQTLSAPIISSHLLDFPTH